MEHAGNCQAEKKFAKLHEELQRALSAAGSNHFPNDMRANLGRNMAGRIRALKIYCANHAAGVSDESEVPENLAKQIDHMKEIVVVSTCTAVPTFSRAEWGCRLSSAHCRRLEVVSSDQQQGQNNDYLT